MVIKYCISLVPGGTCTKDNNVTDGARVSESVTCCSEDKFICSDDIRNLVLCSSSHCFFFLVWVKHAFPIEIHQQLLEVIGDGVVRVQTCQKMLQRGEIWADRHL